MRLRVLVLLGIGLLSAPLSFALDQSTSWFTDVEDTHLYVLSIRELTANDVIEGYVDDTFKPEQSVNRAEFLKMAMAWYDVDVEALDLSGSDCYSDVSEEWFAPYVCTATDRGIVSGYADGTFHPERTINFAEASKILINTFGLAMLDYEEVDAWYEPYVDALATAELIPPTLFAFDQEVTRGEMAEMIYRSTSTWGGPWSTTYDDFKTWQTEGAPAYRVAYASPGASTVYVYLIEGRTFTYLENVSTAALDDSESQLAYFETVEGTLHLRIKNLSTGEIDFDDTSSADGNVTGFSWTEDGTVIRFTSIVWENDYEGVVTAFRLDLLSAEVDFSSEVDSFETNSWYHCGSICVPYPFVWAPSGEFGAILTFSYDEESNEVNTFLVYDSSGQLLETSEALPQVNEEPTTYAWNDAEDALLVEYSDGTVETVEVSW